MARKPFPLQLVSSGKLTPHVLHLAFRRPDDESLEYIAGQFINIHFDAGGRAVHRSYSIATPPGTTDIIEIAVSPVEGGKATQLLFGLQPGDQIKASGPYGKFVLRDDPPCRYVLAGTGTGIVPYRAMLPELSKLLTNNGYSINLLLGVWNRDELLYGDEFIEFSSQHENFHFHACYSRKLPETPTKYEHKGYVQTRFPEMELDAEKDIIYMCGNPGMIDQAMAWFKQREFPTVRLRREKYLPAKV